MHPTTMDKTTKSPAIMNAISDIETANALVGRIEAIETARGITTMAARRAIATRLQALPGTLENLRRLRLKSVPHWLMARIRAEFASALRNEALRLEHEVHLHIQTGGDPGDGDLAKARASLETIKAVLGDNGA